MFLHSGLERTLRALRKIVENSGISEELRGYSWDRPPVEPLNDVKISLSDINGFCSTRRDVYVKYILGEKVKPNKYMLRGLAYHKVIRETISSLKKAIYSGCDDGRTIIEEFFTSDKIPKRICEELGVESGEAIKLYKYLVLQIAARVDEVLSKFHELDVENIVALAIPPFTERRIDGSAVGLSPNLSVDIFTPYATVMDFKSGCERSEHPLSLAGYALALEAESEADVNFGFLIYIKVDKNVRLQQKGFVISDELRREFIEARDEISELIDSGTDPGKPAECPRNCVYYGVCNEGGY